MRRLNRRLPASLVLVVCLGACGPTATQSALHATLVVVNLASDAFVTWDDVQQAAIVGAAATFEQGETKLKEHRTWRAPLVEEFGVTYRAIAEAIDDPSAAHVIVVAKDVHDLWDRYRIVVGTEPPAKEVELP